MSQTERDTRFQGYARELVKELLGLRYQTVYYHDPQMLEHYERIIAQRAYDLACHTAAFMTVPEVQRMCAGMLSPTQAIQHIPDLTEWPEERQNYL